MVDDDITKRGRIWGDNEGLELKTREKGASSGFHSPSCTCPGEL